MKREADVLVIDVVLLPPEFIRDEAMRLNALLNEREPTDNIHLGRVLNRPHISLLMAGVHREDLEPIGDAVQTVLQHFDPMLLTITGVYPYVNPSRTTITSFLIEKTAELQSLHETVLSALSPFMVLPLTKAMLSHPPGEGFSESILAYVNCFLDNSSFERYSPHITLGMGDLRTSDARIPIPGDIVVHTAAICRVGDHGVCSEVLATYELGDTKESE